MAGTQQGGNDMAQKEYDIWLERFRREIGFKSSVILYGNTGDIMMNQANQGRYEPIMQSILASIRSKGYKSVVRWDRIDGISRDSDAVPLVAEEQPAADAAAYDLGDDNDEFAGGQSAGQARYKDPAQFFPYLLNVLSNGVGNTAFVLDYSDYIFGNPNSLSEQERSYLTSLGKALQQGQSYNMTADSFAGVGNLVVIVAHNSGSIPPAYYQGNPLVSSINVPLPGRNERERFVKDNLPCLRVSQDLMSDKSRMDDFIDALDGLTLREIAQIMKLSRQAGDVMGFEQLINLFRYGEKTSPWEELSRDKLMEIEERLGKRVKGQDEAIEKVRNVIIRAYTGFSGLQHSSKQRKPKGTLFFVGPTGVGKTELAKSLAEFVFGDESACIRFDMSEYNHEHSDQRLVGAPPGYVGYEAGGQLTNAVKARPFCVLLFDEIEKAHGKILDKFLQILEDGRLTDGKGETVSFSETIIIFTSNIGAAKVDPELAPAEARKQFIQAVQEHFVTDLQRPELLNRIGENIVAFNFIDDPQVFTQIARAKFRSVEEFVRERYQATLSFADEDAAFMAIAKKTGKANGGRGMLNRMEAAIIDPLSAFIFEREDMLAGRRIEISLVDERHLLYDFNLV